MDDDKTDRSNLSLEDQVLLCGARPVLTAKQTSHLSVLLTSPLNWSELIDQAERHGVAPMLHRHICAMPASIVPDKAMAALAQQARACLAWNLCLQHELIKLLGFFNEAGLPVMPLKGLYIGSLLYDDPLLRPTSDLDVLVQPAHLPVIDQMLEKAGWRKLPSDQQGADYHVSYASSDRNDARIIAELHTDFGEAYVAGLDIQAVWATASPAQWEGRSIWTMAPSDLLLSLCLHAVKDGLGSLRSLLDITLFLERFGRDLSWGELSQRITDNKIETPIYVTLLHCCELLDASVPAEFLDAIRPRRRLSWPCSQALLRWRGGVLHADPAMLTGPVIALQMLLWEDSVRGKLRHLRRNLFPSARLRARWTSLPPSSSPIRLYLAWLWEAGRHLSHQVAVRSHAGSTDSPRR